MSVSTLTILASLAIGAAPATRIAVLLEDAPGAPATAAIERALQQRGYEVVASNASQRMRKVVAPKALLENRLPEGLSVFEADAVLGGAATYSKPTEVEGVMSQSVSLTIRLIDLGTGQATATMQADGVGVGIGGPSLKTRAIGQALDILFSDTGALTTALTKVGQSAGSVVLVVQNLPNREALVDLRAGLERALAGAPVKEIYFAKGLGKLVLGGSKADSMVGPNIADIISENRSLALSVDEVANTRIVARYDKSRTVQVHVLVLEPKLPKRNRKQATELGKYVATQIATFDFAKASYQRGRLSRKQAVTQAEKIGAGVVIESEILGRKGGSALVIRVIDVATGRPILRVQKIVDDPAGQFSTAEALVADLGSRLPEKISSLRPASTVVRSDPTARKEGADR